MSAQSRTGFCTALQTALATAMSVEFVLGPKTGPQRDKPFGAVWFTGKRPHARAGIQEENYYTVRYMPLFKQQEAPTTFAEPNASELTQASETLETALKAVLTTAGHEFFTVIEVTVDYDRQHVDALLIAYDENRSSAGG